MKVILLQEVKGQGGEGDVIEVARGYAVNYLLPKKPAVEATPGALKQLEARRGNIAKRELKRTTDANTLLAAMQGKKVFVGAKVGEEGQLFGSVTTAAIADAINEQIGVNIDKKQVDVRKSIKTAGEHQVPVVIYRDIKALVDIVVVDEKTLAEQLAAAAAPAVEAAVEAAE